MAIIGKFLKKTSKEKFKKFTKQKRAFNTQIRSLFKLIDLGKDTNFGSKYGFNAILLNSDLVSEFQENVPITNYNLFYKEWLKESIKGKKNHTWPGKIKYYALSSGTNGAASKRIPVSSQMIKSFQKTSINQIATLYNLNLNDVVFSAKILVVGGCSKIKKVENHFEGDLSGILKKNTAFIYSPFTLPPRKIAKICDWNEKLEQMVIHAPKWDIGIVTGVPSWCILLMERIIEVYQLKSIHDIWPNFELYIHGGVFIQPYIDRLNRITNKKVHLLDTYLASEGYFAFQAATENEGMQLLLENGVFYEFIPFTDAYFDLEGNLKDNHEAFTLNQVEVGIDYALVISTNAGLWRYLIGDLVQFLDIKKYEIIITGRIKEYLSLAGEHLSLDNINKALVTVNKLLNVEISEFCVIADEKEQRHVWYIGSNMIVDKFDYIDKFDEELKALNDDYSSCRKHNLKAPKIEVVEPDLFYLFLEEIGKSGSQHKFPRVLNKDQGKQWKLFLEKRGVIA